MEGTCARNNLENPFPRPPTEDDHPTEANNKNQHTAQLQEQTTPSCHGCVHRDGPYPWRLEQVMHQDSSENLRGIWVLKVKDMHAV
ncbi:hypothetical protein F5B18DRAFT_657006 [Nemania serpens]|nr:hypothetical protein F5B18DRAFT_657006 [Nemania serpens]